MTTSQEFESSMSEHDQEVDDRFIDGYLKGEKKSIYWKLPFPVQKDSITSKKEPLPVKIMYLAIIGFIVFVFGSFAIAAHKSSEQHIHNYIYTITNDPTTIEEFNSKNLSLTGPKSQKMDLAPQANRMVPGPQD